ncbi:hypothetical protein PMAYCL1PPCAC_26601, partial [Pristionchus mayeri]
MAKKTSLLLQQVYMDFHSISEYREEFAGITRKIFDIYPEEAAVVYGAKLFATEKSSKSAFFFSIYGVLPTYLISYVIFFFCSLKIYRAIKTYGIDNKSQRLVQLQRQFFKTLVLQGLLPLIVLSLPMSCFFVGIVGGFNMDRLTLLLTFSLWIVPTVQGLVSLSFLVKISLNAPQTTST